QIERIEHDVAAEFGSSRSLLSSGEENAQFLFGMNYLRFAGRFDAHSAQEPQGGVVQQPDEWIGSLVKPLQGKADPKRGSQGMLNGQPFGRLFARHDVQEGQGGKTDEE